ncbi:MAG: apolipoprotein N-acyltransferase [Vicinamibacteria bacterium]
MSASAPRLWREGLAAASGLLLVFSFPKFGRDAVAWIALMPLLVALPGTSGWRSFRLGYVTGAVSALGLLYWVSLVIVQYGGIPLPVGIAIMLALCLAFAIFPSLFAWVVARLVTSFGVVGLLGAPVVWVGTELLRAHTALQFPWCQLGYTQYRTLPVIQVASITAVYGVSFLLVASSALLAFIVVERRPGARRAALLGLVALVGGAWGYGAWAMSRPLPETGQIRVGLVQGGIRQEEKWIPERAIDNLERHRELTVEAADRGARLVVWPESSVPFFWGQVPGVVERLRATTLFRDVYLFFGNDDREDDASGESRFYVGAKLLTPKGELAARYRKIQLVPFGEYVPLQPLFTLGGRVAAKAVRQVADFSPGSEAVVAEVDGHLVGGYICYEAIFPALVRRFVVAGAELLINITNDAWYGTTSAPHQHLAMSALRAVENRRYMVRAANTGITAVVDPWGRILEPTRLFERTIVVRDVPFIAEMSFYTRHGDVFAQACLAAGLALLAATFRRRTP